MKSLLGILALLLTVSAHAETDFFGNEVLRCKPGTVATLAQQANKTNRLNVTGTSVFRCASDQGTYLMEISELVIGLKINGPEATGEITFRCPAGSDFTGKYNYFGLAAGFGYAGFIGQAAKLNSDQGDCTLTIAGYEIVELSARAGRINVIPLSR